MATLRIRTDAIAHNVAAVRRRTGARLIAVVKEDGYGLGLGNARAALRQAGVDFFAVGSALEALRLKEMGDEEVLLLTPVFDPDALALLVRKRVLFMLGSREQAEALRRAGEYVGLRPRAGLRLRAELRPRVHLKIDTGLGRYGYADLSHVEEDLRGLQLEGTYTHFASMGRDFAHVCRAQAARFAAALDELRQKGIDPGLTHASATRAFCALGDLGHGAVRLGSALLGRCTGRLAGEFQNAAELEAEIAQVRLRKKGETVGYDALRLRRDTVVGLVRLGHADGVAIRGAETEAGLLGAARSVRRALLQGQPALVRAGGRAVPLLGAVGMNHLLVDLTDTAERTSVRIDVSPLLLRREIPRRLE